MTLPSDQLLAISEQLGLRLLGSNLGGINYSYVAEDTTSKEKCFLKCYLNPKADHVGTGQERQFTEALFCNALANEGLTPRCLRSVRGASVFEFIEGSAVSSLQNPSASVDAMGSVLGRMVCIPFSASEALLECGGLPDPNALTKHVESRIADVLKTFDAELASTLMISLRVTRDFDDKVAVVFRQDNHEGNFILTDHGMRLVDFDHACLASPAYTVGAIYELDLVRHAGLLRAVLKQCDGWLAAIDPSTFYHFSIASMAVRFLWHLGYFRPTQETPDLSRLNDVRQGLTKRIERLRSLTSR